MRLILLASCVCLAACGKSDTVELSNASASDVANEMNKKDVAFVKPGQWEQTATLVAMEASRNACGNCRGDEAADAGSSQVHKVCVTPEQAKNPKADMFTGPGQNCSYEHFKWGGGNVDMKLLCKHPQATQTMTLSGTYEPESYHMAMTMTNTGSSAMENMTMKMKVDAKRVGECDGKQGIDVENGERDLRNLIIAAAAAALLSRLRGGGSSEEGRAAAGDARRRSV